MELNRALERKQRGKLTEVLIFVMHDDHPIRARDKEDGAEAQEKLKKFKERATAGRVRLTFKSDEELRGHVVQSLADAKRRIEAAGGKPAPAPDFHPPNLIPKLPEPYIAHPYSLLQTKDMVGRQAELNLLTDWVTMNKQVPAGTRIFNLVAIGGMGKSALTWKWFNDIAPNELPKLSGRLWWSFYESDAHWENFIIRALAYVSGQAEKAVREMKSPDREDQLWRILDQHPFLLVLDGLERILLAYARMDAAQMLDEDLDDKTANRVAQAIGLPQSAAESFIGKHQLRLTADHRAGDFLRRLARIRNSRILITTRLYPTELQVETGEPLPGCSAQFLPGLTDNDALNLWREFKATGSTKQLLPLFRSFGNYPLLIRALAGEVAAFRGGPGDFDKWRTQNPAFDPTRLPLKNAKTHVLEFALRGLKPEHRQVLHTIAAFRMPATWDTLRALLVEPEHGPQAALTHDDKKMVERTEARAPKPCANDQSLDLILTELEDRGLVGWDKKANRYDLHPIVRSVVWRALDGRDQKGVFQELHAYFNALPIVDEQNTQTVEELTPSVELFCSLVGLGLIDDAVRLLMERLFWALHGRFGRNSMLLELLTSSRDVDLGRVSACSYETRAMIMLMIASAASMNGEPGRAIEAFRSLLGMKASFPGGGDPIQMLAIMMGMSCRAFVHSGRLRETDGLLRRAIDASQSEEEKIFAQLALLARATACAARGIFGEGETLVQQADLLETSKDDKDWKNVKLEVRAQAILWNHEPRKAMSLLGSERIATPTRDFPILDIRLTRLRGEAALGVGDEAAGEFLQQALVEARKLNLVEEELPLLVALADWHRRTAAFLTARDLLEQVTSPAERGPYPLFHADALNVLAQIERDQGNRDAAIAAATKAYTLAWCDGPPYAYHYGLTNARKHLQELGAPEPQLPPFDESKFEPMPAVELNPKDEFWVDPDKLDP